ncbi:hypothetical protein CDL12_18391 [Handroanthus impetiginosus]|uniref:Uncharacterized protein n=1 Tax=Handroanthus impetiginosus TaxID=429701 RepID=A0A2G9GUS5_9LAMI|nr:hypothetical protein CDL12_18391 [Handroanthus impetiginosus]
MGTCKEILDTKKLEICIIVPIGLMYFFATNTKNLQKSWQCKEYISVKLI